MQTLSIWMRNMKDHWEYICVWVDDMLIISKDTKAIIDVLEKEYTLKGAGESKYYLGADMTQIEKPENIFVMGSGTYIKQCLSKYEQILEQSLRGEYIHHWTLRTTQNLISQTFLMKKECIFIGSY